MVTNKEYLLGKDSKAIESLWLRDFDRLWANWFHSGDKAALIQTIKDKFDDRFNKKFNYRLEDTYHVLDHIPTESILEGNDWSVRYSYNSDFFRSDHFKKDHDGLHVVFSGCSNTEGVGADIEKNWSHLVYSELSKTNKLSGYFNLGKGGSGWHQVFHNFKVYVDKFGAPDFLFLNHPNILRNYTWTEEHTKWHYDQCTPFYKSMSDSEKIENIRMHRESFPSWVIAMELFVAYCESIGTKLLWTTWHEVESENIMNLSIFSDTFFPTRTVAGEYLISERPDLKLERDDIRMRDGHPGALAQSQWAKAFIKEIKERDWIKLND